jgi:pimeloyl-ACP methyl ester carboxylesterase
MARAMPHLEGVDHRFVSAGGTRLHVAEAGSGRPLLMLHGWPQHWWMWRRLIGPLAQTHRVLAVDLRGFGWSDAPPGGYEPEVFAADVEGLLGALGIEDPVDLVGHDWGGFTGFMLCLRAPERVRRFLALNILHPFGAASRVAGLRHGWRFWYQWPLAAPAVVPGLHRLAGRVEPSLAWVGGREAGWDEEERRVFLSQFLEPDRAMAAALLYRHAAAKLIPDSVRGKWRNRRLEVPTRILFGDADRVQHPDLLRGYERSAPQMEIELVPGVGHFIVDQATALVLDRARAFLA